jgi:hypothetical protein
MGANRVSAFKLYGYWNERRKFLGGLSERGSRLAPDGFPTCYAG